MAVRYSTGTVNRLFGENGVDTGANGLRGIFKDSKINIYSGAQPADADNAPTGTLLAVVTNGGVAFTPGQAAGGLEFDAPVGKVLSKAAGETWQYTGVANGQALWFRVVGNALDDGSVSTVLPRIDGSIGAGSGDLSLSNINIVIGAPNTVTSFSITPK